jgi:hypothetical protein
VPCAYRGRKLSDGTYTGRRRILELVAFFDKKKSKQFTSYKSANGTVQGKMKDRVVRNTKNLKEEPI